MFIAGGPFDRARWKEPCKINDMAWLLKWAGPSLLVGVAVDVKKMVFLVPSSCYSTLVKKIVVNSNPRLLQV